ncbi:MAG: response regulator [Candidatus Xenobiia bacterium LiM19]
MIESGQSESELPEGASVHSKPIVIIIVEDEVAHSEAIRRAIEAAEKPAVIYVAQTLSEYFQLMKVTQPDIALVDLNLPDGTARDILPVPAKSGSFPIVIMTSYGNEQIAVEAMKAGALEYLVKSAEAFAGIPRIIDRVMREWSMICERRNSEEKIKHLNRVLMAIRGINRLVAQENDRDALLAKICTLLVEHRGYDGAVIILSDDSLVPLAFFEAGMGDRFRPLAEGLKRGNLPPCCIQAWKCGSLLHISDRLRQCGSCPMEVDCVNSDTLCIQIRHGDALFGFLAVSLDSRLGINTEEQSLFAEMAGDVAFGLYAIRQRKLREDAEKERRLMENELRQSQKMDAVGKLAGGVAHDFNNILSVILGYTDLIMNSLHPLDLLYKDITEINIAAQRGTLLTKQLLSFSRKPVIEPRVINLNDVVADYNKMLNRLISEDIDIIFTPSAEIWNIRIDVGQIGQILANLAVNARDALSGVGTVTIETANVTVSHDSCSAHAGIPPGEYVKMSFSDTGIGMNAEILDHIFEPFFTTKETGKGTGLGLSTVFGIVKQNEGHIFVSSTPAMGSTFTIYFPRCHEVVEKHGTDKQEVDLRGKETILVVEDDEFILKMTRKSLELYGYKVLTAATPGEACMVVEKYQDTIHLLLTDVIMPLMTGIELRTKLEKICPAVRTLFMSGYTADIITARGFIKEGMQFISKPFSQIHLAKKVREALES